MPTAPRTIGSYRKRQTRQDRRPNSHRRGYTKRWRKRTEAWLIEQFGMGIVRCAICGRVVGPERKDIHVDHRIAPSTLGPIGSPAYIAAHEDESNWRIACPTCNSAKGNRADVADGGE